jgi:ssDNA-binding Zn-finger/Zn-ribbon topoisomerase 1
MGLTCSLLGHAFEDTDVERDREEQGSEVVTIVREVETCRRCGESRTVSENKEVTAIVEPDDVGAGDDDAGPEPVQDATEDGPTTDHPAADADDGFAGSSNSGSAFDPPDDPTEEDAEILEDDRETPRSPGQWPDEEDGFEPTTLTGEDARGSEGSDPAADTSEDQPAAEPSTGDTPTSGTASEGSSDDSNPSPEPAATSVPTGDYVCPECGFTTPAAESSLRAGDSCPECRRGYLTAQSVRNR